MELTKINDLMFSRGYTKAIAPIFSEWEFVKDEILLPNRKAGSGNGTVHIYLLEDNMNHYCPVKVDKWFFEIIEI